MNLSIPLYIEEHKIPHQPSPQFVLRPLFFAAPREVNQQLSAGMSKVAREIRKVLDGFAEAPRQEGMIPWTFSPPLADETVKFTLQLRRQTAECRFVVVSFEAFDRRFAFTPSLPEVWFEVLRGQSVAARAREVITEHFRRLEKADDELVLATELTTFSRAWITPLEVDIHPHPKLPTPRVEGLLAIFSREAPDGRRELERVGRCLDWQYPDELDRVVLRDGEAAELVRLLSDHDRRPVLLLGPRKVGKTAIIHEAVWRRVSERKTPYVSERNVWLLSPPRLISGMSYVGQWEGRVLAIFEEAKKKGHVLFFDDVLGLYHAGVSADSDLNVAAVMRPWVERREFRMLAEMTPEAFRVLQERDRGLADQFQVLPVREPSELETRRILIHVMRRMEAAHRCRFELDVLPTAMDLQRRYVRDLSMPGKAAGFLGQLGLKYRGRDVTRGDALAEFGAKSGLAVGFLDTAAKLARETVMGSLSKMVIGQDEAVGALADVVAVAKARLNDPGRPLGVFLFLGPTGVGKTQAAKALAAYLFGDEARLVRFDMNEYVEEGSLSRLVGTFGQPEGLLTSAVRRQPYCVLLLDEIEKASPDVFDLLLQVLGEGRLTDALGRTSDFTNAIIIMTSNLGTREASSSFGLRPAKAARREVFLDSAKQFFRPEFFNRIDRVVPFEPLDRADVAAIARQLISGLLQREGLVHRRCVLRVEPAAMDRIIEQGYHPQLGARALKRAVERQLTQPIADRLATMAPDAPTVVTIYPAGGAVAPHVQPLVNAAPVGAPVRDAELADADGLLTRVEEYLNDVEGRLGAEGGDGGKVTRLSADTLSASHFRYLAIREQLGRIDRLIRQIDHAAEVAINNKKRGSRLLGQRTPRGKVQKRVRRLANPQQEYASLLAAQDVHARLAELAESAGQPADEGQERLLDLLHECAMLHVLEGSGPGKDRLLVELRNVGGAEVHPLLVRQRNWYLELFRRRYGFSASAVEQTLDAASAFVLLEMPGIVLAMKGEEGTHLWYPAHENIVPVQVNLIPLEETTDAGEAARGHVERRSAWREAVAAGEATVDSDPTPLLEVVRVYDPERATLDLRTGLLCPEAPGADDLWRFVVAQLPLPRHVLGPAAVSRRE
jgi:ATP-dependent Clp protease ATP-binding subunit ClpA